ncbi:MAG: tetratricopeptide repeat protein [Planctomycetota bacterium]
MSAALAGQPTNGEQALQTGHGLLGKGLYADAIAEYQAALEDLEAERAILEARYGLGVSLAREGSAEQAIEQLGLVESSAEAGYRAEAAALRADLLRSEGRFEEAAEQSERFLARHAEHESAPAVLVIAVESRHRIGDDQAAVRLFERNQQRLSTERARFERAALFAAESLSNLGERNEAISVFRALGAEAEQAWIGESARLRVGLELLASGSHESAAEAFREAAGKSGERTRDHVALGLGSSLRLAGQPARAAEVLSALRERSPGFDVAGASFEHGLALLESGNPATAREVLATAHKAMQAHGDRSPAAYWLAKAELESDDPKSAVARLTALIDRSEPVLPEAMYDLAVGLDRLGRAGEATEVYRRFRQEYPDHTLAPDAQYAEAALRLDAGEHENAERLAARFARANEGHPLLPAALFVAGEAAYREGAYDRAARSLQRAERASPDAELRPRIAYRLGMSLHLLDRFEDAEPYLRDASERPEFAPALKALGDAAYARREWDAAIAYFDRYIDGSDDAPQEMRADAIMRRGLSYARLEEHEEAAGSFQTITNDYESSTHASHARFELGQAYLQLDRLEDAKPLLRETAESGDERFAPYALRHLASIASRLGDAEAAANLLAEASRAGLGAEVRLDQARALVAAGRPAEAAALLEGVRGDDARAGRVVALSSAGRSDEATREFERLDLNELTRETRRLALYHGARALRDSGDAEDAVGAYKMLLEDNPANDPIEAHAMVEFGTLLADRGEAEDASVVLREALQHTALSDPLCATATYRLAWFAADADDAATVLELLSPDLRRCDFGDLTPHAELLLGATLLDLGRARESIEHLQLARSGFDSAPELSGVLLRLGDAFAQDQQWDASRAIFAEHERLFSDSPLWFRAAFGSGWALENGGSPEDAIPFYQRVAEEHRGETAARAQFQLGECLFALKRYEDAVRALLRVDILHNEPTWSAAALYEAGRCYEAIGKVGEARERYREVLDRFGDSEWSSAASDRLGALQSPEGGRRGGSTENRRR